MNTPTPDFAAALADLEEQADLHAGGSVHAPNVIAGHAVTLFTKYRELPAFRAIAEALVKTAK